MDDYVWLFVAGLGGGFLAGLLGIGGGIIYILILPVALSHAGVAEAEIAQYVIANSIFGTAAASLFGSIALMRHREFFWEESAIIGTGGVIISFLLLFFFVNTPVYSKELFNIMVVVFLVFILFISFSRAGSRIIFKKPVDRKKLWLGITGAVAGSMAALSGLGGGTIVVPMLKGGLHMDIKKAKSISLGVILITSTCMTVYNCLEQPALPFHHAHAGYIVFPVALTLSAGVLVSSPLGIKVARAISSKTISYIFIGFVSIVIIKSIINLL